MIDLLLDSSSSHQTVDGNLLLLTEAPCSFSGLDICGWIPIWVENDDPIGSSQVQPKASDFGGQEKHFIKLVLVKLVHKWLTFCNVDVSIQSQVFISLLANKLFENVEHLSGLSKYQGSVVVFPPVLEDLCECNHFARQPPVSILEPFCFHLQKY